MTDPITFFSAAKAAEIAAALNDEPEDDFTYAVEIKGKYAVINVYDEDGIFVGNF